MRFSKLLSTSVIGLTFALPVPAQEPTWTQKLPAASPQGRYAHHMAYDAARGQVVLFGGADTITGTNFHDTWVWDGANWTQKSPSTSPSGTGSQAMAYDAARQQVVMFGGAVGDNVFNTVISSDTWVWDGTTWTQRFPANSPSPRLGAAMVYDPVRQQVVLFGGGPGSPESFGDTWVWDGNNWTQKFPATSPPARSNFGFAFDVARGQAVLYAGRGDGDTWLNDTWVWDGTNWTQKFPATIPTTPRALHRMAYDASRQQVVLFGGHGPSNDPLYDDTWVWDGVNWTQKFPASSPSGRTGHTLAFDEACAEIVLFGGFTGSFADDTWVWGVPSTDPCVIRVEIDIKPDSFPNSINLGSGGTVPVAIFSSPSFDARTIDPLTVSLAGANIALKGKGTPMVSFKDLNGDGLLDMVIHVETEALQLTEGDTIAVLRGKTFGRISVRGEDSVRIVP